jgi:hypothetical protein
MYDGITYDRVRDRDRLTSALEKVFHIMLDREWHSLTHIQSLVWILFKSTVSEAGISARLRDFRKPKFGSHTVDSRHVNNGLWEYRLTPNFDGTTQQVEMVF